MTTPAPALPVNRILCGDVLDVLRTLPGESVHCVVTSPPYWGLRDYGVEGQLGLEPVHDCLGWATGADCGECYLCRMRKVFVDVRRVLRADGTVWVNMGDSFKDKRLVGMPWRLALALQADGWWLRSDIVWAKPNPMPSSVKDRPTVAHGYVFLLAKSRRYFYDHAAVREPAAALNEHDATGPGYAAPGQAAHTGSRPKLQHPSALSFARSVAEPDRPGQSAKQHRPERRQRVPAGWDTGKGSHGTIHRQGRTEATYQPTKKQDALGKREYTGFNERWKTSDPAYTRSMRSVWTIPPAPFPDAHFATFPPTLVERCIKAGCPVGGLVLDPFMGSGTTALVASKLGRRWLGIELNPEYVSMAEDRIHREAGLLAI